MLNPPQLEQREWQLILELLEAERRDLPTEIHHTDSPDVHDRLQQRLRLVESLVARLQKAVAAG